MQYSSFPLPLVSRSRLDRVSAVYLANFLSARRQDASKKSISRLARETDLSKEKKGGKEWQVKMERNRRRAKGKSSSTPDSSRDRLYGALAR